jgi:hypothetical protein
VDVLLDVLLMGGKGQSDDKPKIFHFEPLSKLLCVSLMRALLPAAKHSLSTVVQSPKHVKYIMIAQKQLIL